jgi:hypothetical protein
MEFWISAMGRFRLVVSELPVIRPECLVPQNLNECIGDYAVIESQLGEIHLF